MKQLGTTLKNPVVSQAAEAMQAAFKTGDPKELEAAWTQFQTAVVDTIKNDFDMTNGDEQALLQRGYRVLTAKEKKFYEKWIEGAKSTNPKQAITDLVTIDGGMPETIIEDVYKNLVDEHPLLNAITFTHVSYLTKWLLSDHTVQKAAWGAINSEITKEITSSFKTMDLTQNKLSSFIAIPKDMLELGPQFLDNYIRTILLDSIATALESALVTGTGKSMPIGLDRDIHKGVSVTDGEYPKKKAIKVTKFAPVEYGGLIAKLCKTEKGRYRKIEDLSLVVNPIDYYKKVMPATTCMNAQGSYVHDIFPVPTTTYQSAELEEGEAILFLPKEYFMALGASKEGTLTYDDSYQFLEDNRVYMIKTFANGKAFDDTVALLLDISELDPLFITVMNKTENEAEEEIVTA